MKYSIMHKRCIILQAWCLMLRITMKRVQQIYTSSQLHIAHKWNNRIQQQQSNKCVAKQLLLATNEKFWCHSSLHSACYHFFCWTIQISFKGDTQHMEKCDVKIIYTQQHRSGKMVEISLLLLYCNLTDAILKQMKTSKENEQMTNMGRFLSGISSISPVSPNALFYYFNTSYTWNILLTFYSARS